MGQGDVLRVQMDPTQSADVDRCLAFYENVTALAKSIGDLPLQSLALKVCMLAVESAQKAIFAENYEDGEIKDVKKPEQKEPLRQRDR